jgi:hypothetical protein
MWLLIVLLAVTFVLLFYEYYNKDELQKMILQLQNIEVWQINNGNLKQKTTGNLGSLLVVSDPNIDENLLSQFKTALMPYIPKHTSTTVVYSPLTLRPTLLSDVSSVHKSYEERKFCCVVLLEVTSDTQNVVFALSKYGDVDVIPFINNDMVPVLENYRFVLAMDPESNDGFISTVCFLTVAAGSIPIYSGDVLITGTWFNKDRFIDCRDYVSADDVINDIKQINESKEKWETVVNQPVFQKIPPFLNFNIIKDQIESTF